MNITYLTCVKVWHFCLVWNYISIMFDLKNKYFKAMKWRREWCMCSKYRVVNQSWIRQSNHFQLVFQIPYLWLPFCLRTTHRIPTCDPRKIHGRPPDDPRTTVQNIECGRVFVFFYISKMLASVACRDVYLYAEEARWMECVDDERDVWDLPLMMSELGAGWLLVHSCDGVWFGHSLEQRRDGILSKPKQWMNDGIIILNGEESKLKISKYKTKQGTIMMVENITTISRISNIQIKIHILHNRQWNTFALKLAFILSLLNFNLSRFEWKKIQFRVSVFIGESGCGKAGYREIIRLAMMEDLSSE